MVDKNAKSGDPFRFKFSKPQVKGLDYSYSGLKTSFLYFLRDQIKLDPEFISKNMNDLCASMQYTIVDILLDKLKKAIQETGVKDVAIAGGVSANSGLRAGMVELSEKMKFNVFIPEFKYTTDNAAMIAITGYYKYLKKQFAGQDIAPMARMPF